MYVTDKILSALSNRTRRDAMRLMLDGSDHCLCELMERLDVSQPSMSRHMRTLKQAGLVRDERRAQWVHFQLPEQLPSQVLTLLKAALVLPEDDQPANNTRSKDQAA